MTAHNGKNGRTSTPLVAADPYLEPFDPAIRRRIDKIETTCRRLTRGTGDLGTFAAGHEYFGLHFHGDRWVLREWAPGATAVALIGELTDWRELPDFALTRLDAAGVWAIVLSADALSHGDLYRLRVHWPGGSGDRIPAWARRVVQDRQTRIFNAQVWRPETPYRWRHERFVRPADPPLIYEAHVGMAQETEGVGTFTAFAETVLPRIADAGYNTVQLMAVQEHPYYGSFGYHVSSFFAVSSRFGTPEAFKHLVDAAHDLGIAVIMDLVHSHAVANEVEGLSRFDGTPYQYFHDGPRGRHTAWDSRCFDYGKDGVVHFLLSNCRFWLDEYRVDGFRFDGVTSMLYLHHGLGKAFTAYDDYFDDSVDEDALVYLALANRLIHDLRPDAATLAEDVSGMPGLAAPQADGGIGFDYRFAMGVPDYWIRLTKDTPDENWSMGGLWHELTNRRVQERTISYAESHDQALVGDQTLIFRMIGDGIYDGMRTGDASIRVDRGVALHKMIRLITLATAGSGYLTFMGNEFGHPEWIDFPRPGNDWSYRYARRQWSLADDPSLQYGRLAAFDRDMLALAKGHAIFSDPVPGLMLAHETDKVLAFERAGVVFVFNFHPTRSHNHYRIGTRTGTYTMVLNSDAVGYGGHGRLTADQRHLARRDPSGAAFLRLYLPTRTAIVLLHADEPSAAVSG